MEYRELNRNTLERAIGGLRSYVPEEQTWLAIEAQLEEAEQDRALRIATHSLPLHTPPPLVWENISSALEAQSKPEAKVRKLWQHPAMAVAAAVFGVILVAGWWLYLREDAGTQIVMHSTEVLDISGFEGDWDDDEEAIAMVVSMVDKSPNNENLHSLKTELEELNDAKAMLKDKMNEYGKDAELIRRLSKIERERSKIVKQMAAEI